MDVVRPEFAPDPSLSREGMEALQRDLAATAVFSDDFAFDPIAVRMPGESADGQTRLGETDADAPVVAGVDQAFVGDRAVSAVVALRDGEVVERASAVVETEIPYIPGLLSFREGDAILAAFEALSVEPDVALVDGSGRIHFRQAGIATHVGVMLDLPTVGVAKNLLCGRLREPITDPLPEGARIAVEANSRVDAPEETVIGYAFQSRQYESGKQHINPLYVSPGHRVGAETAVDLVERTCAGYKLPEPTRRADAYADEVKRSVGND